MFVSVIAVIMMSEFVRCRRVCARRSDKHRETLTSATRRPKTKSTKKVVFFVRKNVCFCVYRLRVRTRRSDFVTDHRPFVFVLQRRERTGPRGCSDTTLWDPTTTSPHTGSSLQTACPFEPG